MIFHFNPPITIRHGQGILSGLCIRNRVGVEHAVFGLIGCLRATAGRTGSFGFIGCLRAAGRLHRPDAAIIHQGMFGFPTIWGSDEL
jgi:hypothetical protein